MEDFRDIFAPCVILAFAGQVYGLLINLRTIVYCFQPIDGSLRKLALLNLAHVTAILSGVALLWPDMR